jgi:LacI family transcriptional regulator
MINDHGSDTGRWRMTRVSMEDVARTVGCSFNTVSRALNGKPEISPKTKAKILELAAKHGYKPARRGVIVAGIGNTYIG